MFLKKVRFESQKIQNTKSVMQIQKWVLLGNLSFAEGFKWWKEKMRKLKVLNKFFRCIWKISNLCLVTPKRLLSLKQGPIERYFFWFYKFFSQGVGLQRESNPRRVLLAAGRRRPGCRRRGLGWRPKSWRRATVPRARRGCLAWRTN